MTSAQSEKHGSQQEENDLRTILDRMLDDRMEELAQEREKTRRILEEVYGREAVAGVS